VCHISQVTDLINGAGHKGGIFMKVTQLSSETLDRAHERFEETLAQMTVGVG
jgi:hypothetical protein